MEFIMPSSVMTIIIALLLLATVIFKVVMDTEEVKQSRKLYTTLLGIGKKHSLKSVSVVIELRESADAILPLIDHLYEQKYSKLQVVVIVKHTAGKNAVPQLERYRRKHHLKGFRIVRHVRGMTAKDILRRYATGYLVMSLSKNERVSRDFFSMLSIDALMGTGKTNLIFKNYMSLDRSILSGFQALYSFWSEKLVKSPINLLSTTQIISGVAYNRSGFIDEKTAMPVLSTQAFVHINNKPMSMSVYAQKLAKVVAENLLLSSFLVVVGILLGSGLIILGLMYPRDIWLLAIVLFLIYTATSVHAYVHAKAYSIMDVINLYLLQPFGIVYIVGLYGVALVLTAKNKVNTTIKLLHLTKT